MRKSRSGRLLRVAMLGLLVFLILAPSVGADSVYHTSRIDLQPVGDAPLKSGMVVNIHSNGVQNFAHEIYRLSGAQPNTTYEVVLVAYLESSNCTGTATELPTGAFLTTNAAGNGTAHFAISLATADALGIHGLDVSAMWEVRLGDTAMYRTAACEAISLD